MTVTRTPSEAARSSSAGEAAVSFAITSTCATPLVADRYGCWNGGAEDRMARARNAVLVRTADNLRDVVEVEDRGRRAHLPLERQRVPRVPLGKLSVPPGPDRVVEEDDRRGAEPERGDRDEQVEIGEA